MAAKRFEAAIRQAVAPPLLCVDGRAPERVAVFRALQLGDLLCTVPAFRALRAAFPRAEITLIGLPWARDFARRFSAYFDDFIGFPGHPGLPEGGFEDSAFKRCLEEIRERRFDLALQMHGSGTVTNPLVAEFDAEVAAGYCPGAERCPDPVRFPVWEGIEHEVRRFLLLLDRLGVAPAGEDLEFPILDNDEREFAAIEELGALRTGKYVCIHPGASVAARRWPVDRFAAVAQALSDAGIPVVLTGSQPEAALTAEVARRMKPRPIDVAGKTGLGALGVLLRGARLLVSNDTGVSHVAAALGTPSVVVACASDVERWRPLDGLRHRVLQVPVECRPCDYEVCPIGHPCALEVEADVVAREAFDLMTATAS